MSERIYARFLLFMNAVDDDLLEEALAVPKRRLAAHWKGLAAAAACLCVVLGVLFRQSPAAPESGVTAADLAGYGYELPLPSDARDVRYDLLPSSSEIPIAQAEFDRDGHAVTLRAWRTEQPQDIFDGGSEAWTDQVDWNAGGAALSLRSNARTAQVSWYSNQIQWSVRSDMTTADLLDTVDSIFSALGYQLSNAPEGARDIHYNAFHLDGLAVGETTFTLDGVSCAYRIAPTYDTSPDFADISGVEEEFARQAEAEVGWCSARLAWNDGGAGKVVWFDPVPGQLYSLSVDAGASQEGLLDLAGQMFLPAQDEL